MQPFLQPQTCFLRANKLIVFTSRSPIGWLPTTTSFLLAIFSIVYSTRELVKSGLIRWRRGGEHDGEHGGEHDGEHDGVQNGVHNGVHDGSVSRALTL